MATIIEVMYDSTDTRISDIQRGLPVQALSMGVDEDNAPELVKAFLPMFYIRIRSLAIDLTKWARFIAEHGFEWHQGPCLLYDPPLC